MRYCHEKTPSENLEEEKQRESGVPTNRRAAQKAV
jgi:hypothetical protein